MLKRIMLRNQREARPALSSAAPLSCASTGNGIEAIADTIGSRAHHSPEYGNFARPSVMCITEQ